MNSGTPTDIKALLHYYHTVIHEQGALEKHLTALVRLAGWVRLLTFVSTGIVIYLCWGYLWASMLVALVGVGLFLFLVKRHGALVYKRNLVRNKIKIACDELKAIDYEYSQFDGAPERSNANHLFALDLDVFGPESLFQYINRCALQLGKQKLADYFEQPLIDKSAIEARQVVVQELRRMPDFMLEFRAIAKDVQHDYTNANAAQQGLSGASGSLLNSTFWRIMLWVVPLVYLVLGACALAALVPSGYLMLWWFVTLMLSSLKLKQSKKILDTFDKKLEVLDRYSEMLRQMENASFDSPLLQDLQTRIASSTPKASKALKMLSHYCNNLSNAFAFPVMLIVNPLLLWNVRYAIKIEQWAKQYGQHITRWLDSLAHMEALVSLGNFAYNHPGYTLPVIAPHFALCAQELGHPLMHRDTRVTNDINMEHTPSFMVITGANMAGKSTYLRTIGVNYLLACMGVPVCATSFSFYPSTLVTSLRTSDSLNKSESYFFAELKRLKVILDLLEQGKQPFIILDEILKGTNSLDKQKGSLALIEQLVSMQGTGIIATHDLMLGELASKYPQYVANYCFEAEIEGDNLHFSYKIKPGIAQNMNACFLMQQMGIKM